MPSKFQRFRRRAKPYMQAVAKYGVPIAINAAKTAALVASLVNAEYHSYDRTGQSMTPNTAGSILYLSNMAQGDTEITRNGNSILPKGLTVRFHCQRNTSATQTALRLLCVVDRECDSTEPTLTEVLAVADIQSFRNRDMKGRFGVLYDKTIILDSQRPDRLLSFHKDFNQPQKIPNPKRKWFHIYYDGATAAITDMRKNNIFLFALSDEETNTPTVTVYSRLKWVDN